jgi:pimeloyl-ACP methyl ester carboxylesterase
VPEIEINGGLVSYEFVGPDTGDVVVLTTGSRFSKEFPGIPDVARSLAEGGMRVLLWDRPNCGSSDVQFYGRTESHMRGETMGLLLKKLDLGPVIIAGGSGGARDSMVITMMYPELVRKLAIWSIVGGVYSTLNLLGLYIMRELQALGSGGLDAFIEIPDWANTIKANPRNLDRLNAIGSEGIQKVLRRWMDAFVPKAGQTIPGVSDWEFEDITVPTLIIRNGADDIDHPKRTSLEVSCLIRGSRLVEPPWAEDAWQQSVAGMRAGKGSLFDHWPLAAPLLLDFFREA